MPFVFKRLALFMSIAAAFAADKEAPFKAAPAASYPHHQTNDADHRSAVDPYASGEKIKTAFGKLDPYQYGVLPVLVVIQNDGERGHPAGPAQGGVRRAGQPAGRSHTAEGCALRARAATGRA